jgi:phosphoribosylamine--glycine ligase
VKILIVDTGLALDLARRLSVEGHKVFYFVNWIRAHPVPEETNYGQGFFEYFGIKRVDNFYSMLDRIDLVVFTDIGWGEDVSYLRKAGVPVFGGGGAEVLENDRGFAKEMAEEYGIKVPGTWSFKNADEALKALSDFSEGQYVIKVNVVGDAFTKTYVSVNKSDAINHIKLLESKMADAMGVVVEEFIGGIEYAVGAFFDGKNFVGERCFNFEHKRYFPGDLSCLTGEMGTVIKWEVEGKLFDENLKPMRELLCELGFVGYVDMDFIVNEKGAYLLEWTMRFGYPLLSGQLYSLDFDFGSFMYNCAVGRGDEVDFSVADDKRWVVIVCVNTPPIFGGERFVIFGVKPDDMDFGLADVMMDEGGVITNLPVQTALYQRLLNCCAAGRNLKDAVDGVYRKISKVRMKDITYRNDIGRKLLEGDLDRLISWGYEELLDVSSGR